MELRVLQYFLTTAEELNITRAADVLHVTQPTLSRQLMDLEQELGTTLLIRGKRALSLTEDGLLFKQQAQEIVSLTQKASQTFLNRQETVGGTIALGATEALGSRILVKHMKEFLDRYPQVKFDVHSQMADNIKLALEKGLLDMGLLLEPVDTNKYEFIRFPVKETWGVLLRREHPLAEKETVHVQDLYEYPLILPNRTNARNELLNWMEREENLLNNPINYNILSNAALLVEAGIGIAVCLDGALAIHCSEELIFRPVLPEKTTRSVLLWKKGIRLSSAASLFIQMLRVRYSSQTGETSN